MLLDTLARFSFPILSSYLSGPLRHVNGFPVFGLLWDR